MKDMTMNVRRQQTAAIKYCAAVVSLQNGECRTANADRRTPNAERRTPNAERRIHTCKSYNVKCLPGQQLKAYHAYNQC